MGYLDWMFLIWLIFKTIIYGVFKHMDKLRLDRPHRCLIWIFWYILLLPMKFPMNFSNSNRNLSFLLKEEEVRDYIDNFQILLIYNFAYFVHQQQLRQVLPSRHWPMSYSHWQMMNHWFWTQLEFDGNFLHSQFMDKKLLRIIQQLVHN